MSLTPLPLDHPTWNGSAIYWLHIHIVISEQNLESKHLGLTWINRIVIVHVHTCIESCYSYLGKYTYIDWFRSFGMHLCLTFVIGLMPSKWWWHFFVEFRWESFPKSLGWGGGILICTGMMDPTIAISYNTNCVNLVIFTGFKTSQINRGTPSNTVCFARSRSSRSPISRQLKEKVWLFKSCSVSWQQRAHLAFSVAYTPVSLAMLLYPVHIHLYVQYLLYIFQNSTTVKNLQQDAPILLRRAIYQYIYIYHSYPDQDSLKSSRSNPEKWVNRRAVEAGASHGSPHMPNEKARSPRHHQRGYGRAPVNETESSMLRWPSCWLEVQSSRKKFAVNRKTTDDFFKFQSQRWLKQHI